MLDQTSKCVFAHSSKDFKHDAPSDLVFCMAWDAQSTGGVHSIESSRLFASTDYFAQDRQVIDFGIGTRLSRGVVALGVVSKFMVAALRDLSSGNNGEMVLYVTVDAKTWAKAHFPHGSSSKLVENSYTIVESTTHSLAIDVQSHASRGIGTLFVSNSNGTFFVESLKDTHRSDVGYVDFEELVGIDGVGLANYVTNARQVDGGKTVKAKLKSVITYDDGSSWDPIHPPEKNMHGQNFKCSPSTDKNGKADSRCSLHLHSVSTPHNLGRVFSSTAPGYVMGVGSVGESLEDYDNSDLYISTDAGRSWKQVHHGAHKYEFGDQGNVMVIINDEEITEDIRYSIDGGKTW
jgi:Sortilin, neurotensin receptor 3,